jgi:iron complex outermembrane receptor protein
MKTQTDSLFSRFALTSTLVVLVSLFSFGQTGTVKGTVKDASGESLPGATISVSQNKVIAVTDLSGQYTLKLPAGTFQLLVTYIGFETQKITVKVIANTSVSQDITLASNAQYLKDSLVVIGTRNPKRTSTDNPVPIDVIPIRQISNQVGQLDLSQLLNYLAPSFNSVRQSLGDGTDHIDPAQLRGLGPDQVLVLVNGKRYHQSSLVNVNGTVNKGSIGTDLNSIPASSIQRIEILRDGASAQYGSDAIAGVINIVLTNKPGLTVNASYGENITSYDKNYSWNKLNSDKQLPGSVNVTDGTNVQLSASYGIPFKKGNLELAAEYLNRGSSNRVGLYTGQLWPKVKDADRSDSINTAKGLDRNDFDMHVGNASVKGGGFTANLRYTLNSKFELYATAIANFKKGYAHGFYRYPSTLAVGQSNFPSSNSSSTAAVAKVLSLYPNGYLPEENSDVKDYHFSAGVKGKVKGWDLDISETFGANNYTYLVDNSVNYTQAYVSTVTASDLQTSFNSGATKVYQSVTNVDISKNHNVLAGLNTAFGAEFRLDGYGIEAGELNSYANLSGDDKLAGAAGAQAFGGFLPDNSGSWTRTSFALYSDNELEVSKKWLISGALRFENFSDFGPSLNYKLATRYKLTDWFALRGSISTGFRAPSLQQEHYSKVTTQFVNVNGVLTPYQIGTFTNDSKIAGILGIPELDKETSVSYSLGATAKITKGLELTVDAYQIDIKNRIILTNNFNGGSNAALTAELNAAGASSAYLFANAIDTRSRGIEAVLTYFKKLNTNSSLNFTLAHSSIQNRVKTNADGHLDIHASDELINSGQLNKYFNRADQSRIESYSPQTKDVLTTQYNYKKVGILVRLSYFGEVSYWADSTGAAAALASGNNGGNYSKNAFNNNVLENLDQTFSGKVITDLTLSYAASKNVSINIGANNLFDVYPDKQTHSGNASSGRFTYSRAVSQFGYNGRYVFAKIVLNFL